MTFRQALTAGAVGAAAAAAIVAPVATSARMFRNQHRRHHVHKRRDGRVRASLTTGGNVNCAGTQSTAVRYDLTVPAGKTCTIKAGVAVGHDVYVEKGSTLIDQGAIVGYDINATAGPKGIGIGGPAGTPGSVGHDIDVTGTSGAGPGTNAGNNYICDTVVGHNIDVQGSTSGAGQWIVGDRDEQCTTGGNLVGFNLYVDNNKNRVDVSDNMQGSLPYVGGIANNLYVTGNAVTATSPIVESNFIGDNATCQAGTTTDGDGAHNIVGAHNNGCP